MKSLGSVAAVAACVVALPAAAGASPAPRTLLGVTDQFPCQMDDGPLCGAVNVDLSRNRQRVKRVVIGYEATCGAPGRYYATAMLAKSIPAGPRFTKVSQIVDDLPEGRTGVSDVTLKGRFNPKRGTARGTLHIAIRVYDAGQGQSGQPLDTCDSGTIKWSASRATRQG
jgi:hypothetical protein